MYYKILLAFSILWLSLISSTVFAAQQWEQGIYLTQPTLEDTNALKDLITKSKEVGITTFVVDFQKLTHRYQRNIPLLKQNGLKYVARIIVFPDGAQNSQVQSLAYREKIYKLVTGAIQLGAEEIQLDYIRYASTQPPSKQNAVRIYSVIKWFKTRLAAQNIPLQIDVFGISSFGDSIYIGQSLKLFGSSVDAMCPMVYPSHYEPYRKYATRPYYIVHASLKALHGQFQNGAIPFKVYPYIETYNYRYKLSEQGKLDYIYKQLQAVKDSNVNGWYAWNIHNDYDNLFLVMKQMANENSETENQED